MVAMRSIKVFQGYSKPFKAIQVIFLKEHFNPARQKSLFLSQPPLHQSITPLSALPKLNCVSHGLTLAFAAMKTRFTLAKWLSAASVFSLVFAAHTWAADFTLKVADKEAPKEIDTSIRGTLQPKSIQVLEGDKPIYEFWLASGATVSAKPESAAKSLAALKPTTLLGVVIVAGDKRDYRNDELSGGVYTMRYGLQPQDGDHLGASDFPYFGVLIAAKTDTKLDGFSAQEPMLKASSKETSTGHPLILSLRPVSADDSGLPKLTEPAPEHQCVRIKIPAKGGGEVVFDLVVKGKVKK
jgi:hypothetical protein